jgi:phage gp16-like protein
MQCMIRHNFIISGAARQSKSMCAPVEADEGRTAHNNGWNGANGMASNTVSDVVDTFPLIPL